MCVLSHFGHYQGMVPFIPGTIGICLVMLVTVLILSVFPVPKHMTV